MAIFNPIQLNTKKLLDNYLSKIEKHFDADVLTYNAPIVDDLVTNFTKVIEDLSKSSPSESLEKNAKKLIIILTTIGGSAQAVERQVNIIRKHYEEVFFIIPDYAYSVGTIFCMSGDKIYMDYASVLGPIDPQVLNKDGKWVAALGYLDKVNEMIEKSKKDELTQHEFLILQNMDLAELREYEQAKELTIDLLKKWLVKYKFKNWDKSEKEKEKRAEEIADKLGNNNLWKSHSRPINIDILDGLKLKIENYSGDEKLRSLIKEYYDLTCDYKKLFEYTTFVHTRLL